MEDVGHCCFFFLTLLWGMGFLMPSLAPQLPAQTVGGFELRPTVGLPNSLRIHDCFFFFLS